MKTSVDDYDSVGLFGIDATEQEILNIINGEPKKTSVSLGADAAHGRKLIDMAYNLLNGKDIKKNSICLLKLLTHQMPKNIMKEFMQMKNNILITNF